MLDKETYPPSGAGAAGGDAALAPSEAERHLQPLDEIHHRVKYVFLLLTLLSGIILATMGVRLVLAERFRYVDVGWMAFFALAMVLLTFAEIGCLRYIQGHVRPHLVTLVLRDELTGAFNRRYINDRVDEEIARSRRHRRRFALIYLDLDGFKQVNDRFGHEAGDWVLRKLTLWLHENVRREDIVARIAGDEFLVLLPDTTASSAANLLIRLHTRFAATQFTLPGSGQLDFLSFSAGLAVFPEDGLDRTALLAVADKNMFEHKATKKAEKAKAEQAGAAQAKTEQGKVDPPVESARDS